VSSSQHDRPSAPDEGPLTGASVTPEEPAAGPASASPLQSAAQPGRWLLPKWVAVASLLVLIALVVWAGFAVFGVIRASREARFGAQDAIEAARARTRRSPHDVRARLELAYLYQRAADTTSALTEYRRILRDSPDDVAALYGQGLMLLALERPSEAVVALWKVLGHEPGHVAAASALGDYYASVGQYRSLVVAVRPATVAHPDEAHLQYLMGVAYEHLGHPDWAAARYRLALEADPGIPEALAGLKRVSANH